MPIDPKKLAAVAGGQSGPVMPPKGGGGGAKPPKGGNPHDEAHPDMDEKDETAADEADELPENLKSYAKLVKLLEDNATDVEEQCEGLDADMLASDESPDDENKQEIEDCLESLPDDLVSEMKSSLKGVSKDDAQALANHLEDEGFVTDADAVAGFLFHCGQVYAAGGGEGDDSDDESGDDEDYGDDEDDDEDY